MDYINAVRAALKAAAPVVAIPVEGRVPVCIKARLLKGALKGVTIDSVVIEKAYYTDHPHACVIITGHAGRVHTSCKIRTIARHNALIAIREWTIKEREKRIRVINQGILSAQAQRELKKKRIESEADAVLIAAKKEEQRILAAAKAHINPVMDSVSDDARERTLESYAAFRAQRGNRKRGAVIRWKLAKLRKDKAELVKNEGRRDKKMVLRRKKDAVKYAALVYQIGKLQKQYETLYQPVFGPYDWWHDSWIEKRPKAQTVNPADWWRTKEHDSYSRMDEARKLKEARANIRALTPPVDDTEQLEIAA